MTVQKKDVVTCDNRQCDAVQAVYEPFAKFLREEDWCTVELYDGPQLTYCPRHHMTAFNMGLIDEEPAWKKKKNNG